MSGRNFNASSSMLKYVIFLYFVLLSSNCNAYPSLLTGIKGDNKETRSVTDALQNIIMRQLTMISECMSQKSSDIRNDVLINKKTSEQTQKELMIMKEEIKQLKEQLSKIKMEMTEYKATTDETLERQENIITDINLNTKEFKEIYQNSTQELSERVDKQDDQINQQRKSQLKQTNDNERLENTMRQLKESHQNDTKQLIIKLKEQDDKYDKQSKILIKQENINGRLENEIRALKENYQNKTPELVTQLKEQDDKFDEQSKRLVKQENINGRLENEIRALKENHYSIKEDYQNKTQELVIQLQEQNDKNDEQSKRQIKQQKINGKLEKEIRELKKSHHSLTEKHQNYTQMLVTQLKEQEDKNDQQSKRLMKQEKINERLENQIRQLKENKYSLNETLRNDTQNWFIQLMEKGTCKDILRGSACRIFNCRSGVYSIYVNDKATPVWCDMETDGGGWTVIQRRQNGNVDFYRTWKEYKIGFGNASDEYWIGNDALHVLTSSKKMKLRVDLQQFNGNKRHATFSTFVVANETNKYRLSLSGYTGDKGINSCFSHNNGRQFSTYDKDNDDWSSSNCAVDHHGGWWYGYCTVSNLNGRYFSSPTDNITSVYCVDWTGYTFTALQSTTMMVR